MGYATCFNIYGEEFAVKTVRANKKFKLDLYYGHSLEKKGQRGKAKLILTKELKAFLIKNKKVHASEFGEHLSMNTIKNLRRELKRNPYKSYDAWQKSQNKNKPKEITFLKRKEHPEFLTDYFGKVYVLASASVARSGIVLPKGTLKEIYFSKDPQQKGVNNKEYIVTKEMVDFIRKHKYSVKVATEGLSTSGNMNIVIRTIRKNLGYDKTIVEEIDMWVAAHLEKIFDMSCAVFIERYTQDIDLGKGDVIVNFKTYANHLLKYAQSRAKKDKTILNIVRSLDEGVDIKEVRKALQKHLPKSRGELTKAYNILMIARDCKYTIPKNLQKLLKQTSP